MNSQETFVINILPQEKDLEVLDEVKKYFYTHDFKYTRKTSYSRPHLTIGRFTSTADWESLANDIKKIVAAHQNLVVNVARVSDEITKTVQHREGEGWVALVFDDHQIKELYYKFDSLFTRYDINDNMAYIDAIRAVKGGHLDTFDCIANHINLCNKCRPERVVEAKAYILENVPPTLTFDTLIVRRADADEEDVRLELKF